MKNYILIAILTTFSIMETMAQFPPTKEQIANMQKIKELQKTNKNGKNSKAIIKLMNQSREIAKAVQAKTPKKVTPKKK